VGGRFAELFRMRERERIEAWSRGTLESAQTSPRRLQESPEAELVNGLRVRIRNPLPAGEDQVALFFEPLSSSRGREGRAEIELRNVLEWLEEGVVVLGARQEVRAMNTRFAQITGLGPQEAEECGTLEALIAHLSEKAAEPESFAGTWRELARGINSGVREELQLARPVPRVLERAARPILDDVGRRLGHVEIYRDLTAQRVFQSKLLQTEKLAALGQMLAGVAHELSNPLTTILGYSQRLLLRKDALGRSEETRQIFQEAERASTILRQLLLTARETRPERRRVSLNQVVLRTLELQRFSLAVEKIRIETDLDPVLPYIHGDAAQLQQVLMNLIGNARQSIDHQGQGGTIRLRTARTADLRVLLEVEDTGPGVPEAILARIFDPFFTTKPAGVGTGLGLAIVLSIVREHGGRVHVSNPPGGGAIFSVELPAAAAVAETASHLAPARETCRTAAVPPRASAEPATRLQPALHRRRENVRVLVVEDEPTVARLIADVLADEGYQADVLFDAREALARAAHERYDLVICDMKMPGLDGQTFFQSLVQAENPLRDCFLFVTGDVIAPATHAFLERNRLPHVAKPFRVEELIEKVRGLLESRAPSSQPDAPMKKNATWNG
jgi:signal transduction histidine kinase/ActR/RegA family two-component response regulator